MSIHPTAVVSPEATIGRDVHIGPYSVIEGDAVIGDDCWIDAHVKIASQTTLGPRCRVYFGALIGEEPQDHRFRPGTPATTVIGADTVLREYVTIHRSPFEGGVTSVGDKTLLMAFVHIGHDVIIGDRVTIANNTALSGHVQVGQGAVFSGFVLVHQFCRIGALAMVGPGAHIGQDIPPFCMLRESNVITGPNTIGLRRAGMSNEQRLAIRRAIRTFFFEGLNAKNALEQIERGENVLPEVHMFVNFIKESHRGIMPGNPRFVGISDEQRELIESQTT